MYLSFNNRCPNDRFRQGNGQIGLKFGAESKLSATGGL
jgi:hypothetical protein